MSTPHVTDSREVAALRDSYRQQYRDQASPWRLGRYAAEHKITIRDFGAHSARWIKLFKGGLKSARTYPT